MATDVTFEVGEELTYTRTFTNEEVQEFAELSKDEGYHHVVGDADGTVILHGLLTATMPTKLGGDIDYVARNMHFEFPQPAYTGVEITCTTTFEDVEENDGRTELAVSFECVTEHGDVVLEGSSEGVVMG